jgi:hypothetical protein
MYLVGVLNFALMSKLMFSPAVLCSKYCSTGGYQVAQEVGYDQSSAKLSKRDVLVRQRGEDQWMAKCRK